MSKPTLEDALALYDAASGPWSPERAAAEAELTGFRDLHASNLFFSALTEIVLLRLSAWAGPCNGCAELRSKLYEAERERESYAEALRASASPTEEPKR